MGNAQGVQSTEELLVLPVLVELVCFCWGARVSQMSQRMKDVRNRAQRQQGVEVEVTTARARAHDRWLQYKPNSNSRSLSGSSRQPVFLRRR